MRRNNLTIPAILAVLPAMAWAAQPASAPSSMPVSTASRPAATTQPTTAPVKGPRALSREEELHQLKARQALLTKDQAENEMNKTKVELDEIQTLYDEGLVTKDQYNSARQKHEQAKLQFRQAEIDVQKTRLEALSDATLIDVIDARKYRGDGGEVMADIILRNDSDLQKARVVMESAGASGADQADVAGLLKVDHVVVTLRGTVPVEVAEGQLQGQKMSSERAIVGDPFQKVETDLRYGEERKLTYRLLKKDVENVTVSLEFLGQQKDYDVFLKKDSQQDLPDITSTQYSLVGPLGSKVRFDIGLERLSKTEQSFALVVLNLPPEIPCNFIDPTSSAILTQVKFTEEVSRQGLYLEASVPEKLNAALIDKSQTFYVLVARQSELKQIAELKQQFHGAIPVEEIAKLPANRVELELIPQGVGKLEILVPNLYKEVKRGQDVEVKFNILNSGTLTLHEVLPELDLPLDWEGDIAPKEGQTIDGGAKTVFTAHIRPPKDVAVGEYSVRLKCQGHSGTEVIEAVNKDMNIRLASDSGITGTVILVSLLVLLVLGIAIASIKISRR